MFDIIISLFLGTLAATFSSSIFYRLPRNIKLYGFLDDKLKPFCAKCNHSLKFYEYYSLISWITCKGKCSYCKTPIDKSYILLESSIILLSVLNAYFYGIGEHYIINIFISIILVSILAIRLSNQAVPGSLYLSLMFISILRSTYFQLELMDVLLNFGITSFLIMLILKNIPKSTNYVDTILILGSSYIYFGDIKLYIKYLLTSVGVFAVIKFFNFLGVVKNSLNPKISLFSSIFGWILFTFL